MLFEKIAIELMIIIIIIFTLILIRDYKKEFDTPLLFLSPLILIIVILTACFIGVLLSIF